MAPVVDLTGQPLLDRSLGSVNPTLRTTAHLIEMPWYGTPDGVVSSHGFQICLEPVRLNKATYGFKFAIGRNPIIEMRGVAGCDCLPGTINLDEFEPLADQGVRFTPARAPVRGEL